MVDNIFITGATGFLGRNILKLILEKDEATRVSLLVRANSSYEARFRIRKVLESIHLKVNIHKLIKRITIVRGDVGSDYLGLSTNLYSKLAKNITHIIHSAAAVNFKLPLEEARRTNLTGTKNILAFAQYVQKKGNLNKVAHISTAFVSGNRSGVILEEDLENNQEFANSYEQSKFESEQLVRQYMDELPITVFRPSIIVGNSITGETTSFNVMYLPLNLIYQGKLKVLAGNKDNPLDIVPVNFVSEAIYHITMNCKDCIGKTFHLTVGKENTIAAGEIINSAMNYFKEICAVTEIPPVKFLSISTIKRIRDKYKGRISKSLILADMYKQYLCTKRSFDNTSTLTALRGTKIKAKPLQDYYDKLLKFSIACNWGKQIPTVLE